MAKPPVSCSDGQLGQPAACTRHAPHPVGTSSEERKHLHHSACVQHHCWSVKSLFVWVPSHIYTMERSSLRDYGLHSTEQLLKLTMLRNCDGRRQGRIGLN